VPKGTEVGECAWPRGMILFYLYKGCIWLEKVKCVCILY